MYTNYLDLERYPMSDANSSTEELYIWKQLDPDEPQYWCYVGDRRYLVADAILKVKDHKYYGAIYDIDLDKLQDYLQMDYFRKEDISYINTLDEDYEIACAIADCIECEDCDRETELFDTEEELWEHIQTIRG